MFAWHVHHEDLYEQLWAGEEGLRARQAYIRRNKPSSERARRLFRLRVVRNQAKLGRLHDALGVAISPRARAGIRGAITRLHRAECKRCPWNGETIFPERVK